MGILHADDDANFDFIFSLPVSYSLYGGRLSFHSQAGQSENSVLIGIGEKLYEPFLTIKLPRAKRFPAREVVTWAKLVGSSDSLVLASFQYGSLATSECAILGCLCIYAFAALHQRPFIVRHFISRKMLVAGNRKKASGFPSAAYAREFSRDRPRTSLGYGSGY